MWRDEQQLSKAIEKLLKDRKILKQRNQASNINCGIADREFLYKGVLVRLEIKNPNGGIPSKLQLRKLEDVNKQGGIGLLVDNLEIVEALLDYMDKNFLNSTKRCERFIRWWEVQKNKNEC